VTWTGVGPGFPFGNRSRTFGSPDVWRFPHELLAHESRRAAHRARTHAFGESRPVSTHGYDRLRSPVQTLHSTTLRQDDLAPGRGDLRRHDVAASHDSRQLAHCCCTRPCGWARHPSAPALLIAPETSSNIAAIGHATRHHLQQLSTSTELHFARSLHEGASSSHRRGIPDPCRSATYTPSPLRIYMRPRAPPQSLPGAASRDDGIEEGGGRGQAERRTHL